jgi:hypothetical protein
MRRALLLFALMSGSASAQAALRPGSLVRLRPFERFEVRRQGYVVSVAGDSALVRFAPVPEWELRGDVLNVALRTLEVRTGIKRRTRGGAIVGAVAGMFAGYITGKYIGGELCEGSPYYRTQQCRPDTSAEGPLAVLGGVAGAGIGATVGWFAKVETWRPAAPP